MQTKGDSNLEQKETKGNELCKGAKGSEFEHERTL
jgi:hypothetical protein